MITAEQRARDLLERLDVEGAQSYSAGEIVELANLLVEVDRLRGVIETIRGIAVSGGCLSLPHGNAHREFQAILAVIKRTEQP